MDEGNDHNLQIVVNYYRNKCSQLEFDYLQYQIDAESKIRQLTEQLESANNK